MKHRYASLLTLAILLVAQMAQGYVPHGLHILELMRQEMGEAKSLQVLQKLIVHQAEPVSAPSSETQPQTPPSPMALPEAPPEPIALSETVMYLFPFAYRSEIASQYTRRIHVFSNGAAITIFDQQVVSDTETDFDRYKDLFLYNSRDKLEVHLPRVGVDPTISSVGRFQGRIGYVLGAQYPDESVPQIWVDKKSFRPFRWLIRPGSPANPAAALEVRFYGWRQIGTIWYPSRIEYYQGEHLIRTILVEKVKVDPDLPGRLFDIRRLQAEYPQRKPTPPEQRPSAEKSEAQETVDKFRKLFE